MDIENLDMGKNIYPFRGISIRCNRAMELGINMLA